ncbi:CAP domain-containing protein [Deinococcus detaillensis]|nr:CAP domain-containing protein [Deinococcus detaillensis]
MTSTHLWRSAAFLGLALSLAACSTLPTPRTPSSQAGGSQANLPQASSQLTLSPSKVQTLGLGSSSTLVVGQTQTFTVYVGGKPAAPGQLMWTTTNAGVVSVTQGGGTITATGAGSATVRAALTASPSAFLDFPVTVNAVGAPTPTPPPTTSAYAQRVLQLTNAARSTARTCGSVSLPAVPALSISAQLTASAQGHASDMAALNYFSHTSQDGRTFDQRVSNASYLWSSVGENIAAGQPTPEAVVSGWLASPGHCTNLMNARFTQIGVGYAQGGSYGSYWVQDFGRPR